MEQGQTFVNRPRLRMAKMLSDAPERETMRRRSVRGALERAGRRDVAPRLVEALVRAEFADTFDWPTAWHLDRLLPDLVRRVEADPAAAEKVAAAFGL